MAARPLFYLHHQEARAASRWLSRLFWFGTLIGVGIYFLIAFSIAFAIAALITLFTHSDIVRSAKKQNIL
ncbi:hypothetical protein [Suttonella ornithocola]|uniref:Uncharacterized protein n=1 Tax=Suttonella ornithocola TaxID=279832 RepID=A0A380MSH9_9GAMM|nr:hypothetical protein [Suttonella ornithocola]SUO95589.1 Uncharacterised protein [Suttonella ornithocola]